MINVFKIGGDWKSEGGIEYDVKPVNKLSEAKEGYFESLELAIESQSKQKQKQKSKTKQEKGE
tara:strand:+ start:354 stop:542 length:189 start_codon:yes stop_codon:yes gene_type:complete